MVNKFIYTILASALAIGMVGCGDNGSAAQKTNAAPAAAAAPATPAAKDAKTNIKDTDKQTFEQKASAAFGTALGLSIKDQLDLMKHDVNVVIDKKFMQDAFIAATNGKPKMSKDDMDAAMNELQREIQANIDKKAAENVKLGAAFLAANAKKDGVKTTASGLQYKIEKVGTGSKPSATDAIKVNYKGYTIDGKVFDQSKKGESVEVNLGQGLIKGWKEGFQLLPVGSKATFYIPADLAYGKNSPSTKILPNSVLIFDVELVEIVPQGQSEKNKAGNAAAKIETNKADTAKADAKKVDAKKTDEKKTPAASVKPNK